MSNFPEDVRNYDQDPRSPFYIEPDVVCEVCLLAKACQEMANDSVCNNCMDEAEDL